MYVRNACETYTDFIHLRLDEDGHDRNEDCQGKAGSYTCSDNKRYTVSFYYNTCYAANFVTVEMQRTRLEEI
jgi:hypothetical protein